MELGLANKTALATGGSKGIGLETDRALAREGVKVLICARRESALAEAARDIMRTTQAKIETHPLDVTKVDQIEIIPASSPTNWAASTFSSTMPAPAPTSHSSKSPMRNSSRAWQSISLLNFASVSVWCR